MPLVAYGSVMRSNGANGFLNTISPEYLPVTLTPTSPGMSPP